MEMMRKFLVFYKLESLVEVFQQNQIDDLEFLKKIAPEDLYQLSKDLKIPVFSKLKLSRAIQSDFHHFTNHLHTEKTYEVPLSSNETLELEIMSPTAALPVAVNDSVAVNNSVDVRSNFVPVPVNSDSSSSVHPVSVSVPVPAPNYSAPKDIDPVYPDNIIDLKYVMEFDDEVKFYNATPREIYQSAYDIISLDKFREYVQGQRPYRWELQQKVNKLSAKWQEMSSGITKCCRAKNIIYSITH